MDPSRAPEDGSHATEQQTLTKQKRTVKCDACYGIVPTRGALHLIACDHIYCTKCIVIMFKHATKNEADFPPSCCSHAIELKHAASCLHRPQIKAYEKRAAEFNTPVDQRRYCADPTCSSFLGRANKRLLRCTKCTKLTCNDCREHAHFQKCTIQIENHQLEQLQKLRKEEGWQQCPKCRLIVDLRDGCNHITCSCNHQFCYLCAAEWRTCSCPKYGRAHLHPIEWQEWQGWQDLQWEFPHMGMMWMAPERRQGRIQGFWRHFVERFMA